MRISARERRVIAICSQSIAWFKLMRETPSDTVFSLLAKPIADELRSLGFAEPTAPQVKAIPHILEGRNVLLLAPTGSGKTEAVLLPVLSNFLKQPTENRRGIAILYITPLRALNRDMIKRLNHWAAKLDFSAEVRHGDTHVKIRRKQALHPPSLLVTTPETLQAILPGAKMRAHLRNVRHVIIDEVHELAGDKRGVQLTVALERLRRLTGREFQRIGLSATVGNPEQIARFVAGTDRAIEVIEVPLPKSYLFKVEYPQPADSDYELAYELNTAPEAAARIRRILDLVKEHGSALIFVNSRTNAEMLGRRFDQLGSEIAVHHGSLSREERAFIEDEFKNGRLKAIVCTSTLELGIDIGHIALVIQYLSPRQVNSLIQRVGRSGHRVDAVSKGVIITAFQDDLLEALAAVENAAAKKLEPVVINENALDVLAHQIVGVLMDEAQISVKNLLTLVRQAYPYRGLSEEKLLEVAGYLHLLRELQLEGDTLRRTRKSWRYYYENLSMIPDEKRYPIVNIITDRVIGTLGDEFMALKARIGLNFICRGKVWRIVQIEDETGTVHVVPSEDPLAAIPGWDGEMLPVPYTLAQQVGLKRRRIAEKLATLASVKEASEALAKELGIDAPVIAVVGEEINEQLKSGAPVPHDKLMLIEGFDKYFIIHACFGEGVNRTLGCVLDAVLSDHELVVGWWTDGYRILIEAPRKLERQDLDRLKAILRGFDEAKIESAFQSYLESRFPFGYKMKFVAERFGALPRGRTMSMERMEQLANMFRKTPVYEETLREVFHEKIDLPFLKKIVEAVSSGEIQVETWLSRKKPTPIALHILEKYGEAMELMAPERVLASNVDKIEKTIMARKATLLCLSCGNVLSDKRIRELPENLVCGKCGSGLLTLVRFGQKPESLKTLFSKRKKGEPLSKEELEQLAYARRVADLVLSHGKRAVVALNMRGVGPETASRILARMHESRDEFYLDLLKAKIQYLRTKPYWENGEKAARA